jgi:hypothetical protein
MLAMALLSLASNGTAESCWRWRCGVLLVMSMLRQLGHGTMYMMCRAARPESGSTTGVVMCDWSWDVPRL